jgi:hypothetical protein
MALPGREGNRRRALFPRLLQGLRDGMNRAGTKNQCRVKPFVRASEKDEQKIEAGFPESLLGPWPISSSAAD